MQIIGGLSAVSVDGVTITGNGTPGNPLVGAGASVPGWPLTFYSCGGPSGGGTIGLTNAANTLTIWGIVLPAKVQFNSILLHIITLDATNLYDVGLYNSAGTLVAHCGPGHINANGAVSFAMIGGPITLNPGRYYLATTGNSTTATYTYSNPTDGYWTFAQYQSFGSSSGGALPSTITPPADNPKQNTGANCALSI